MSWSFSSAKVHELVKAPKCLAPGQSLAFSAQGQHGKELSVALELIDGGLYNVRFIASAARAGVPDTYEAALLLNNRRVRGIGFSKIERKKRFGKVHIPKGWHENIIDYLLPTTDDGHNRHELLPDFRVTDLQHFLRQACARWNIQVDFGQDLW